VFFPIPFAKHSCKERAYKVHKLVLTNILIYGDNIVIMICCSVEPEIIDANMSQTDILETLRRSANCVCLFISARYGWNVYCI